MIKKLIFCLGCWLFAFSAFAGPVADISTVRFQFESVRLSEFVKVVYSELLNQSYIIDNDLLIAQDLVTLDLRNQSEPQIRQQIARVLESKGFTVDLNQGVAYIHKAKPETAKEDEKNLFVYRPKYRATVYLIDLSKQFFNKSSFMTSRQIEGNASAPAKSETSAYALIDRADKDVIVFEGSEKEITKLKNLYGQLDTPAGEVLVKAVVYEVRKDKKDGNAVDLALGLLSSVRGFGFEISNGADSKNAFKIKYGDVNAVWSALSSDVRFKLVSSPSLRVRSGSTARFMTGQEVPVLGAVSYQGTSGTPVRSVEYKPSGVILKLMPDVRPEGSIDLDIDQQISSFVQTTNGVNDSPTLLKRELKTAVTLSGDEMVLLGGLDESKNEESESGISFLPAFLRGSSEAEAKTEILMLLHVTRL